VLFKTDAAGKKRVDIKAVFCDSIDVSIMKNKPSFADPGFVITNRVRPDNRRESTLAVWGES
jgi:hypothetical protein